ncbi:hypothetical protein CMU23_06950 [Elizabethkingia anophelis]|nr:hypothetical protein [Elizabethkingia anophelis]MDV3829663.1 hypothetical protein [Elizabethkingia anophelis]
MKIGDKAKADPNLTGLEDWREGIIIDIIENPFLGEEIAIKDDSGRIFFGEAKYFKSVDSQEKLGEKSLEMGTTSQTTDIPDNFENDFDKEDWTW